MVLNRCCLGSAAIYAMFGHRFCYKLLQYEISSHHSLEENIEQIKIDNLCRFVDVLWIPQAEHVGTDCESSTIE